MTAWCPRCRGLLWFNLRQQTWHCTRPTAFCSMVYTEQGLAMGYAVFA